jgi:predicted ATPase/class 3 adenylate cyclase/DNA-binding winged helix-turn-helix (wHTH) protein
MLFRVLGPLEVSNDGRLLELRGTKERRLLALLLLHRNELVPTGRLAEELWPGRGPQSANKLARGCVSRLRHRLGGDPESRIATRASGYALRVDDGELDRDRFEALLTRAEQELAASSPARAAELIDEGLDLWRGEPFADAADASFARDEIARLSELRLHARELRIDADLSLGRHAEVVPELEVLVAAEPLRERLREQLMLALYRSGRRAEALDVYDSTRRVLSDELGIEPTSSLVQLSTRVLRRDPTLELPHRPAGVAAVLPAAAAPPAGSEARDDAQPERRKPATVVFSDLDGSTALGEQLDPEQLRQLLGRYLELSAGVFQRHGGTIEKFIGDAVVAVFGVPSVHEDDALRSVRAALELRALLDESNERFLEEFGVALAIQVGINSGVVIATDPATDEAFVTGQALNIAAILQQAAAPGEILLGEATWRLVRDTVQAEALEPLPVKGTTRSERPYRVLELVEAGGEARFAAPLVGRETELGHLRETFARTCRESTCSLVTLVGPAGIGKSRLAAELRLELADQARVLVGRCLSYGEEISFWPLREMLVQAVGRDLEGGLPGLLADDPRAEWLTASVSSLIGLGERRSLEEGTAAARRLLECLAAQGPLVLIFEDVHWAAPALLDLVEQLAELSREAPIMVVCLARPELLESRPQWEAATIVLEPLPEPEALQLCDWLDARRALPGEARTGALRLAEGNPLFLEQLLMFAAEGNWSVDQQLPPTLEGLLAARVDHLEAAERAVVERAAVVGRDFDVDALAALAPEAVRPMLAAHLTELARKELIRPLRRAPDEPAAYRFRHVLIRDAAYGMMPKELRAELHERFADWLEVHVDDAELVDELVGRQLEKAYRWRLDLTRSTSAVAALAQRASLRLESAGRKARGRSDLAAAGDLLEQAAALLDDHDSRRPQLVADLAAALMDAGKLARADAVLTEATRSSAAVADERSSARLLVERKFLEHYRAEIGSRDEQLEVVDRLIGVLERADDQRGLCRARQLEAALHWSAADAAAAAQAWERAAHHARRCGDEAERAVILSWIGSSMWFGPVAVNAGIVRCQEIRDALHGHRASEAHILRTLGALHGAAGHFEFARECFSVSNAMAEELGLGLDAAVSHQEALIEMLNGNFDVAEERLREGYDALEAMGENDLRATTAAFLARVLFAEGRYSEARELADLAATLADSGDLVTQIVIRGVRSKLLARAGAHRDAERLGLEAVALAETTDFLNFHADALLDVADAREIAGRVADASAAAADALALYERKGSVVAAARVRERLKAWGYECDDAQQQLPTTAGSSDLEVLE